MLYNIDEVNNFLTVNWIRRRKSLEGITRYSIEDVNITIKNQILINFFDKYRSAQNLVLRQSSQKIRTYDKFMLDLAVFICIFCSSHYKAHSRAGLQEMGEDVEDIIYQWYQ